MKYGVAKYGTFKYVGNVVRDSSLICELNGACGKNSPASTILPDLSGNGNDATLVGLDMNELSGFNDDTIHGLKFNGGQQVPIPLLKGLSLNTITIETCFCPIELPQSGYFAMIASISASQYIGLYSNSGELRLSLNVGGAQKVIIQSGAVEVGKIYDINITYDGSNLRGYINGVEMTGSPVACTGLLSVQSATYSFVGTFSSINYKFKGNIYTTRIYNRALSDTEITQNYNARFQTSGYVKDASLILDWNFGVGINNVTGSPNNYSVTNLCTNGDFNVQSGWTAISTRGSISYEQEDYNWVLKCTGNGGNTAPGFIKTITNILIKDNIYYAKCKIKPDSMDCKSVRVWNGTDVAVLALNPTIDVWSVGSTTFNATANYNSINFYHYYIDATTANGKSCYFDDVVLINLTALFGSGNEPSASFCDKYFTNYIDGTQQFSLPSPIVSDLNIANSWVFDGLDDYINCGNNAVLDLTTQGTIEVYAKTDLDYPSVDANNNYKTLVSHSGSTATSGISYLLWWIGTNSTRTLRLIIGDGVNSYVVSYTMDFKKSYQHIVAKWDSTGLYLYVNGVQVASNIVDINKSAQIVAGSTLKIGASNNSPLYYWNGQIQYAKIYNTALTDAQITTAYNNRNLILSDTTPQLYISAPRQAGSNSSSSTSITDFSGKGNTCTLTNFNFTATSGWLYAKNNGQLVSFDFDENSGWVDEEQSPKKRYLKFNSPMVWNNNINTGNESLRFPNAINFGTGDFTIEMWVSLRGFNGTIGNLFGNCLGLFQQSVPAGIECYINSLAQPIIVLKDGVNVYSKLLSSIGSILNNGFIHITFTKTSDRIKSYYNGILKYDEAHTVTGNVNGVGIFSIMSRADTILNYTSASYNVNGEFGAFRIYNKALSADEVLDNYNAGYDYVDLTQVKSSSIFSNKSTDTSSRLMKALRNIISFSNESDTTANRVSKQSRTSDTYSDTSKMYSNRVNIFGRVANYFTNASELITSRISKQSRQADNYAVSSFENASRKVVSKRDVNMYSQKSTLTVSRINKMKQLAEMYGIECNSDAMIKLKGTLAYSNVYKRFMKADVYQRKMKATVEK